MNPDEFWPDDYNQNEFEDDLNRMQNLMTWCARKSVKYVNAGIRIDFNAPGEENNNNKKVEKILVNTRQAS